MNGIIEIQVQCDLYRASTPAHRVIYSVYSHFKGEEHSKWNLIVVKDIHEKIILYVTDLSSGIVCTGTSLTYPATEKLKRTIQESGILLTPKRGEG